MLQAGIRVRRLKGFIAGPFNVKAWQSARQVDLYVAPLKDSMLLGMDFLRNHKAKLDLDAGTLCLGGETIRMTWGWSLVPREAQVTLIRKIKVPAGSAVLCPVLYASHLPRQWELDDCLSDRRLPSPGFVREVL